MDAGVQKGMMGKAGNLVKGAFKGAYDWTRQKAIASKDDIVGGILPLWVLFVIGLLFLVCFIVWLKYRGVYETPNNIRDIVSARYSMGNVIVARHSARKDMVDYLRNEISDKPANETILSNFYFSTVNATGLFYPEELSSDTPSKMEYVFSPEAIKFACMGGARAFVFDIWPSMDAQGGFRPILQVVEEGSNWRRISMNTMEFSTALQKIISELYTFNNNDLCVLYLRFNGTPRSETYKGVAAALGKHALPYLLDPTFAYGRGMRNDRLMNTSIRELKGKAIIVCNKTRGELEKSAPTLYPFVNICPEESRKVEYTVAELDNDATPETTKKNIMSSLTFVVPSLFDEKTHTNEWNWGKAFEYGIHCIAMNPFSTYTRSSEVYYGYNDPEDPNKTSVPPKFSKYSYLLKDSTLYKKLVVIQEAPVSKNPGIGTGELTNATGVDPMVGLDNCINPYNELVRLYTEVLSQNELGAYKGRVRNDQRPEVMEIRKTYDNLIAPEKNRFASNNCNQDASRAAEIRRLELEYANKISELLG